MPKHYMHLDQYFWASILETYHFRVYTHGGVFFPAKIWILGLKNKPLVTERAYRVSTSAYLVYGSLIPQIMETWGWMAALIRSKTNI